MSDKSSKDKRTIVNIKPERMQSQIASQKWTNDDWGTIAFCISRENIQDKFFDPELRYNCIYFLIGYDIDKELCYVGQAKKRNNGESVLARLREHDKSTTEPYCDKWDWIIAVTNKNDTWSLDDLNALEHAFYNEIPAVQNLNGNTPNYGGADFSNYIDKINQIKSYITAIGFSIFADISEKENIQVISEINEHSTVEDLQNGMARIPEIVTPDKIVKQMVDMLPAEVWNSKTVFLDPACKGGEYLREIYDRLMDCELLQSEFPNDIERSNHILKNQIYGIALSQVSLERTAKKLLGEDRNIRIIPNYIDILKGFDLRTKPVRSQYNIRDILNKEFNKDMKFNVIVGNPPYQETTSGGKNGGVAIYDKFIALSLDIADRVCMIVKNNWMNSDSLKGIRQLILDNGLRTLINYSLLGDAFSGMGIAASIIDIEKGYTGTIQYTEIQKNTIINQYNEDIKNIGFIPSSKYEFTIAAKIKTIAKDYFDKHVIGNNPFGIDTNGVIGNNRFIDDSVIETDHYNILLKYVDNVTYISIEDIPRNTDLIDSYKIICPKQIHKTNNPIPSVQGLKPNQICSGSFSLMYCDKDMKKAENVARYIRTRFFRFLTFILADSLCRLNAYRVSLVPDQDFTQSSDIDWSQSITNIDQQLYKKYNLTPEEITYIEQMIKSMDTPLQQQPNSAKIHLTAADAEANYINQKLNQ